VRQAWNSGGAAGGWDMSVHVDMHSVSAAWKRLLSVAPTTATAKKYEEEDVHVVALDYECVRGQLLERPTIRYSLLRRLWQCMGLRTVSPSTDTSRGDDDDHQWTGREVITAHRSGRLLSQ
jgi:hypothetical protein